MENWPFHRVGCYGYNNTLEVEVGKCSSGKRMQTFICKPNEAKTLKELKPLFRNQGGVNMLELSNSNSFYT